MTTTETEAFEAMLAHHRALDEHVGIRVAALTGAVDCRESARGRGGRAGRLIWPTRCFPTPWPRSTPSTGSPELTPS